MRLILFFVIIVVLEGLRRHQNCMVAIKVLYDCDADRDIQTSDKLAPLEKILEK